VIQIDSSRSRETYASSRSSASDSIGGPSDNVLTSRAAPSCVGHMAYRVPGRYGAGLQQRLLCLVAGETVPVDVYEEQVVVGALVTRVARPRSSPSARALMTIAEHHRAVPIHLTGEFGLAKRCR